MLETTIPGLIRATWGVCQQCKRTNSPEISTASHSLDCHPCSWQKEPHVAILICEFPHSSIYLNPRNCQCIHNHFECNDEAWKKDVHVVPDPRWGWQIGLNGKAAAGGEQHNMWEHVDHWTVPDMMLSQNSIAIVFSPVHEPEWQFWVEFINSCCGIQLFRETRHSDIFWSKLLHRWCCASFVHVFQQ